MCGISLNIRVIDRLALKIICAVHFAAFLQGFFYYIYPVFVALSRCLCAIKIRRRFLICKLNGLLFQLVKLFESFIKPLILFIKFIHLVGMFRKLFGGIVNCFFKPYCRSDCNSRNAYPAA